MRLITAFDRIEGYSHGIGLVLIVGLMMHPLHSLLGVSIKYLFVATVAYLMGLAFVDLKAPLKKGVIRTGLVIFLLGLFGSFISGSFHQLFIGITGAVLVLLGASITRICDEKLIMRMLIWIDIALLGASWISYFYAYFGGLPILWVENLETKVPLPLYLFSFSNSVEANIIRPSGFFDEPGALAMFNILVVALNEIINKKKLTSLVLLFLGLISFSVMEAIALVIFLVINVYWLFTLVNKFPIRFVAATIIFVLALEAQYDALYLQFLRRLNFENGWISGDNRLGQVILFFNVLNPRIFFQGANAQDIISEGDLSSNPFSILFESGIFIWIPYFMMEIFLLKMAFSKCSGIKFSAIIIFILLLQRPYIFSLYNGLFIWIVMIILSDKYKNVIQIKPPYLGSVKNAHRDYA